MKNAQCTRCLNKFEEKNIYTIQQFQYRKDPNYKWTIEFLKKQKIGEWDSLCEDCVKHYAAISSDAWVKHNKK